MIPSEYTNEMESSIEEGFGTGDIWNQDTMREWVMVFIENSCTYYADNWKICMDLRMTEFDEAKNLGQLAFNAWCEVYGNLESYEYYADKWEIIDEDEWQTEADQIGERII